MNRYGWIRDKFDPRDKLFAFSKTIPLPTRVDLREQMPPVYNQSSLGSCTANAIAAAADFQRRRQGSPSISPSRLFIYWNERQMEGSVDQDAGAMIRDGMKVIAKLGVCQESDWPYDITKFRDKPGQPCFDKALMYQALEYVRIQQTIFDMQHCLASGFPFVFGFTVYDQFESSECAKTGMVEMPKPGENALGGHAVLAVGYETDRFIVRNSWGDGWGDKGYFRIPFNYLQNPQLAQDFWSLRIEE